MRTKEDISACRREYRQRPEVKAKERAYKASYEKRKRAEDPNYGKQFYIRYGKPWKEKNWEHFLALSRSYYYADKETHLARRKAWGIKNPERQKQLWAARDAKRRKAEGKCSLKEWRTRCVEFFWLCAYCSEPLTAKTATRDHVIPLSIGGSNWPVNIVPACLDCNTKKHTQLWIPATPLYMEKGGATISES